MFDYHRKSPWFAEKYDPAPQFSTLRARVRKVGWRGRIDAFLLELDAGKYDPDLEEHELEVPASPVKDSATNGVSAADPNNADHSEDQPTTGGEDDLQFNVEPEDDGNEQGGHRVDGGRSDVKRGKFNEEMAVEPDGNQVMIRTIPPDIGRVKLEQVCLSESHKSCFRDLLYCRLAQAYLDMYIWRLGIPCRNETTTVLGGFASVTMLICRLSLRRCRKRR